MPKSSNRKNDTRRANRDRRQRLEEMRRQQRAAERRKNVMFITSAVVAGVALIAAAVIPAVLHDRAKKAKFKAGYQAKPTAAEKAAGCTGVHNDPVSPPGRHTFSPIDYSKAKYGDNRHGTPPVPPSGGAHNPVPLSVASRFYGLDGSPRPERAVHNLEHGFVVAWYDSKLSTADVTKLELFAKDPNLPRFLAVGWTQGDLPGGKHFVLTSWGRTDRCATVSDTVVNAFYRAHVDNKLAPEAGSEAGPSYCPASTLATNKPPCVRPPSASGSPSPSPSKM